MGRLAPHVIPLPGTPIGLEIWDAAEPSRDYPTIAHLHRDELTALATAKEVGAERGARVVTLTGPRERRVDFEVDGRRFSFDPNRVFTPRGRELTVEGPPAGRTQALEVATAFARAFLAALGPGPWIAAHNNSPGPPLSIHTFVPAGVEGGSAAAVHVASQHAEDDFALVTTPALFDGYRAAGCNVALQAPGADDDGSLSIYADRQGVPYVNIEALEEHPEEQAALLRLGFDLLGRLRTSLALNIDLGELPDEPEELYRLAHWANLACGGHVGDAPSMRTALERCVRFGVRVGAHPSYADRAHFGRRPLRLSPQEVAAQVSDQLETLRDLAEELGTTLRHVKAHGALYHALATDPALASAYLDAVEEVLGRKMLIVGQAKGSLSDEAHRRSLPYARECFADRALDDRGELVPRDQPEALILDPDEAARMTTRHRVAGDAETICVHGDSPGAVAIARAVRAALSETR